MDARQSFPKRFWGYAVNKQKENICSMKIRWWWTRMLWPISKWCLRWHSYRCKGIICKVCYVGEIGNDVWDNHTCQSSAFYRKAQNYVAEWVLIGHEHLSAFTKHSKSVNGCTIWLWYQVEGISFDYEAIELMGSAYKFCWVVTVVLELYQMNVKSAF